MLALGGCAPAPNGGERVALREKSRLLLEAQCGECHVGTLDSALPGALAVFDLSQTEWSASMSDAQLQDAFVRVSGLAPAEGTTVTKDDVAAFARFIDHERDGVDDAPVGRLSPP